MTEKKSLHEIVIDHFHINSLLIESMGEITPEIEKLMDMNERQLVDKLDSYAGLIKNFKGQSEYFKDMAKQFAQKATHFDNAIKSLKIRMMDAMEDVGETKVKGDFSHSLQTRQSIDFLPEEADFTALSEQGFGSFEFKADKAKMKKELVVDGVSQEDFIVVKQSKFVTSR